MSDRGKASFETMDMVSTGISPEKSYDGKQPLVSEKGLQNTDILNKAFDVDDSLSIEKGFSSDIKKIGAGGIGAGALIEGGRRLLKSEDTKELGKTLIDEGIGNAVDYGKDQFEGKGFLSSTRKLISRAKPVANVVPDDLKAGIDKVSRFNRINTTLAKNGSGPAKNTIMANRQAQGAHLTGLKPDANAYRGAQKVQEGISIPVGGRRPGSYDKPLVKELDDSLTVEKGLREKLGKNMDAGTRVSERAMQNRPVYPEKAEKYDKAAKKLFGKFDELRGTIKKSFKAVQNKIEGEGYTKEQAGAILASKTRKASAAAKAKNPNLNKVKGIQKGLNIGAILDDAVPFALRRIRDKKDDPAKTNKGISPLDDSLVIEKGIREKLGKVLDAGTRVSDKAMKWRSVNPGKAEKYDRAAKKIFGKFEEMKGKNIGATQKETPRGEDYLGKFTKKNEGINKGLSSLIVE